MATPSHPSKALPPMLYGTAWKKDNTARLVHEALDAGFRGVDTACQPKHYDEAGVGAGIAAFLKGGKAARSDLYVQTKFTSIDGQDPNRIPYDSKLPLREQVLQSCDVSRTNLGVDFLDCLVLHSPMRTQEQTLIVWAAFEELVALGSVRSLGMSNCYDLPTLRVVWEHAQVKPAVLQNRFYRETGYDVGLRQFCNQVGIKYQSFWTLTANPHVLSNEAVTNAAARLRWTPAQAFLRCLTQIGIVPLIGATTPAHMAQDLAIFGAELSPHEVESILRILH